MGFPTEAQARADLAAAHQMAVYDGLSEGTWNHFSVMIDETRMLITPADRHWDLVTPDSLVLTAAPDDVPDLPAQFWIGYRIHAAVHAARPDAQAVLHTHPPYATALSLLEDAHLIVASQISADLGGRVVVSEAYDGLAGLRQGEVIAETLGDHTAAILRGHGVAVVGPTIQQAYADLYLLERACQTQVLALSTGRAIRPFTPGQAAALVHRDDPDEANRHFEAMRAMLSSKGALCA